MNLTTPTTNPYVYQVPLKDKAGNETGLFGAEVTDHTSNRQQIVHSPISSESYKTNIYRAKIFKNQIPHSVIFPQIFPTSFDLNSDSSIGILFSGSKFSIKKTQNDDITQIEEEILGDATKINTWVNTNPKNNFSNKFPAFQHEPKELSAETIKIKTEELALMIHELGLKRFDKPRYNRHGIAAIAESDSKTYVFLVNPTTGIILKFPAEYNGTINNYFIKDKCNFTLIQNCVWHDQRPVMLKNGNNKTYKYYLNGEEATRIDWPQIETPFLEEDRLSEKNESIQALMS